MKRGQVVRLIGALIAAAILTTPVRAQPDDSVRHRQVYNLNVITLGMSLYYSHHGRLPQSLRDLMDGNWVPGNLANACTGETITGDSTDAEPGGYLIECLGNEGMRLTYFRDGRNTVLEYDLEELMIGPERLTLEEARTHLWMSWAFRCLQAYEGITDELPESIDDLIEAGFWPFRGVTNMVTGKPMAFDSDNPGDMHWVFKDNLIGVRFTLPPTPRGGRKPTVVLEYPTPSGRVIYVESNESS
jgi:hypothetical protein